VLRLFPTAVTAFLKHHHKKFTGNAAMFFPTAAEAKAAVSRTAQISLSSTLESLTINMTTLRTKRRGKPSGT